MITLWPLFHRDRLCVGIHGDRHGKVLQAVREFPGRAFSITHRCWYIGHDPQQFETLKSILSGFDDVHVEGDLGKADKPRPELNEN